MLSFYSLNRKKITKKGKLIMELRPLGIATENIEETGLKVTNK